MTKRIRERLQEIGRGRFTHEGNCPQATLWLAKEGLVEIYGRTIAANGRVMRKGNACITDAGRAALAETEA